MSFRVPASSTTVIVSSSHKTRQFTVAVDVFVTLLFLLYVDVTSAIIGDADRDTRRDAAHVNDLEEIRRQIQFDDARLHYRLSAELINALTAVGLQLPRIQAVGDDGRRHVYQVNSSLDGGSTNHCVILFGHVISRTESADGVTVQFADDVDMSGSRLTTVTLSFLEYNRKSSDRMTSHMHELSSSLYNLLYIVFCDCSF